MILCKHRRLTTVNRVWRRSHRLKLRAGGAMTHPAATSPLWGTAWRTQPEGGPAILGGAYDPDVLYAAYRHGYFPMVEEHLPPRRSRVPVLPGSVRPIELTWWAPRYRPVILRSTVRVGRRMRQT